MAGRIYETVFSLGGQISRSFTNTFRRAGTITSDFGKALYRVTQYAGAFALVNGAAGSISNLAGSIGEFQDSINQLRASTGASKEETAELSASVKNLYNQNIGDSWSDLADALSKAKQVTKEEGKELETTARNAIVFRDVFGEDIPESVKASDTMVKNFGITSSQAFNLMAQGAQKGLDKSGELLDSANEYAPHFASLGFSADQMFDTFSAGLESGAFNLDKVGDAVKEFNIRSKDMSKTSVEAYQALGLNAEKMSQTFAKGGPEAQAAFRQIVKAISAVEDPVKKNEIGVGLMGTMFEDLEKDVVAAMGTARSQFDMTKDTMGEITEIKYDSVKYAFRGIGRQLMTTFVMPIGEKVLPLLNDFSNWFQGAMPGIQSFFGKIGGAIDKVFGGIGKTIGPIFQSLFSGDIGGAGFNYAKMLGMSDGDAAAIGQGFSSVFSEVMSLKDQFLKGWDNVMPHIKSIMDSGKKIFQTFAPIVAKVAIGVYQAGTKIVRALLPIGQYIGAKLWPIASKVFGFLANDVAPAISRAFSSMVPVFTSVAGKVGRTISAVFTVVKPIIDGLVGAFNIAFPIIKSIVLGAIEAVSGVFKGLMKTFGGVLDFVSGVFTGDWSLAWSGVVDTFSGIWAGLKALVAAPINAVIRLVNKAIEGINNVSVDIPDWLGGGTLGFNVGLIPELEGFAKGGIATKPSIFGEAGPEMAIPLNNKPRSHALLDKANQIMGGPSTAASSSPIYITYAPKNYWSGDVSKEKAQEITRIQHDDFEQRMKKYTKQKQRVSFA
ncbi:phage tail tape measure protein [Paenibacillus lautus]|uniref:phage tail tape measure protein n=1 Tax=Paenibacillus lautus TaxID=1401 RepID=UPI003D26E9A4